MGLNLSNSVGLNLSNAMGLNLSNSVGLNLSNATMMNLSNAIRLNLACLWAETQQCHVFFFVSGDCSVPLDSDSLTNRPSSMALRSDFCLWILILHIMVSNY